MVSRRRRHLKKASSPYRNIYSITFSLNCSELARWCRLKTDVSFNVIKVCRKTTFKLTAISQKRGVEISLYTCARVSKYLCVGKKGIIFGCLGYLTARNQGLDRESRLIFTLKTKIGKRKQISRSIFFKDC